MKLSSIAVGTLVAAVSLGAQRPAAAAVIYNGGAPDQNGQIFSETPVVGAMSFTLTSSVTITGADWWGGCYPSTTCGSSPFFEIDVWTDDAGTPGTVIDFRPVGTGNQTATGLLIGGSSGWDEYAYSVTFGSFTLAAGTYFISIQETEAEPAGTWGWETTSSAPVGAQLAWFDGTSWESLPETLAFDLLGSSSAVVPEPASLSLFAAGLAGLTALGFARRRRLG